MIGVSCWYTGYEVVAGGSCEGLAFDMDVGAAC